MDTSSSRSLLIDTTYESPRRDLNKSVLSVTPTPLKTIDERRSKSNSRNYGMTLAPRTQRSDIKLIDLGIMKVKNKWDFDEYKAPNNDSYFYKIKHGIKWSSK